MEEVKSKKVVDNVQQFKACVDPKYSYAFGQSSRPLIYKTLGAMLDETCEKFPDRMAVISTHEDYQATFQQLKSDVDSLAFWLVNSLRIARGDVIVTMTGNTYKSLILQFVAAKIGAILYPINAFYTKHEVEFSLNKVNPKMFIIPGPESEQEKCINRFHLLVTSIVEKLPKSLEYIVLLDGKQQTENIGKAKVLMFDDLMQSARNINQMNESSETDINNNASPPEFNDPDSPALLLSTSGTTGPPKAAILSHFNIINNGQMMGYRAGMTEGSRVCLPVPLFHSFGAVVGVVPIVTQGCTTVLIGYRYSAEAVTSAIIGHECTHLLSVPAMMIDILDYLDKNKHLSITSLTHVLAAATLVPYQVAEKMSKVVNSLKTIDIAYGATEASPGITVPISSDSLYDKLDNVGLPLDHVEVKIIDQVSGEMVKIGEKGELLARGHNIFMGYWNDETQTKACMNKAHWYKTGDLATMDSKGYIRIVGRLKDIIIRGGLNIYPGEIEDALISHPLISFSAVFGIPDDRLGEEICAWIKFRDESKKLTEEQVIKFCKEKMAYFKVPRKLVFVTEFPTTASGKVQKYRMKEISMSMFNQVQTKS
ncbi:acyl-CoA synthetase family member 2, mitochondrial [Tetranychus urticae]|uniref:Medium-chain acyl-CoA ligase ACSF2, mitochondrial n=1 Tax=Tetranychus urticae TaxID=32264 RepID=T1KNP9_TETUR|nr:acyl-CoA synthetase family member 2, mitochondrial [Tetranychus urticae]